MDRRKTLGYFNIIRYFQILWNALVLFESGVGLVASVYRSYRGTTKKSEQKYNWYAKNEVKKKSYKTFN